jgi:hypothetical protein
LSSEALAEEGTSLRGFAASVGELNLSSEALAEEGTNLRGATGLGAYPKGVVRSTLEAARRSFSEPAGRSILTGTRADECRPSGRVGLGDAKRHVPIQETGGHIMSEFLNKAITAHSAWKGRLRTAIDGGDVPDPSTVRADNLCDLGKWIHGEGKAHQSLPEFQALKEQHAHFHQAAAHIIDLVKKGDKAGADNDLMRGQFAAASGKVIASITALKAKGV